MAHEDRMKNNNILFEVLFHMFIWMGCATIQDNMGGIPLYLVYFSCIKSQYFLVFYLLVGI